ncbi:MAG TPA: anti-sigma factor antagonist [Terriglobales bacterium]|nr:anti-sigma factor antagonist [Terriglobales bacterium]
MPLVMNSRPVGEVMVIQCNGRIVAGGEVFTLQSRVGDVLQKHTDVVLQLEQVPFVDSSGLGALVRLASSAREKGGDIKLCGVQQNVRKTLEMTFLHSLFETYESEAEAITAAYLGSRYSKNKSGDPDSRVLCVHDSVLVCTVLREVLCRAGYNALTIGNIDDACLLLKATKARLILLGAHLHSVRGKASKSAFEAIDPTVTVVQLDADFEKQDPGECLPKLLESIRTTIQGRSLQ